jgi:EAL domain-containing protein (putative c-di-GMP-specific phosphodiesterase class I)
MIDRATRDLQRWLAAGLDVKRVAVNVSNLELRADDYSDRVIGTLRDRGITFDRFEIEVTETAAFDDNIAAIGRNLRNLAAQGISIALDDFGTGFASLTHLKSLPISRVKIDRSFIGNIVADLESRSIVDAIVRLSHSLGKSVVVEGVEDEAQLAAVRELDSDIAQGFLFSRPVPAEEVAPLLLRHTAKRLARPPRRDAAASEVVIRKAS